jgi:hypothetical protein
MELAALPAWRPTIQLERIVGRRTRTGWLGSGIHCGSFTCGVWGPGRGGGSRSCRPASRGGDD